MKTSNFIPAKAQPALEGGHGYLKGDDARDATDASVVEGVIRYQGVNAHSAFK